MNGKQPCSLLLENIVDTNPHHSSFGFGNHSQRIRSIVINEDLQTLVVGDFSGTVIQYDLCNGRSSLKVIRHYGNIGIGRILSSTRINNFVIFGGDSFCFRVIDTAKRMMVTSSIRTSVECITSLTICRKSNEDVFLCVVGSFPVAGDDPDVFKISGFEQKSSTQGLQKQKGCIVKRIFTRE